MWAGAFMTCFPIFYAVIVNDMRRVLAYSMINQLGFMVCGIGIGTALADDPDLTARDVEIHREAVRLVLCAAALGKGGETFVLDMGNPVKIAVRDGLHVVAGA